MNSLLRSFRYAAAGIAQCLLRERNFRIHITAVCTVIWLSRFYPFARGEKALLAALCGLVLAAELMNTAVERTVDLVTQERRPLAKYAKDAAAGVCWPPRYAQPRSAFSCLDSGNRCWRVWIIFWNGPAGFFSSPLRRRARLFLSLQTGTGF